MCILRVLCFVMDVTYSYVNDYHCESEAEDDDEDVPEPPRKRRRLNDENRTWLKDADFESSAEAEASIDKALWKICSENRTAAGFRVEYRCVHGAFRRRECPTGLYLLYHSTSQKVTRFKADADHDNHVTQLRRGLTDEAKTFIREKFDDGIRKPKAILSLMRQKHLPEPPKAKVISYLQTLR